MNLPNKLTLFRMILTPFYLIAMTVERPGHFLAAFIIFAVAAITDAMDGHLARKYDQITVFGKLVDPVADKMLTTAALLAFLANGWCSIWAVMLILAREFLITSMRLCASAQGVVIPANIWGKIKTVCQMVFTLVIMAAAQVDAWIALPFTQILPTVYNILIWITAGLTVISGVIYCIKGKKLIDFSK